MKCFYHSADLDGKCSAAIYKIHYPEIELIGINYGQPFPWETIEKNERVAMVDFSLQPFSDMIRLNEICDLVWIDHHKTAIAEEEASKVPFTGFREVGTAGCELTWMFINFHVPSLPRAVYLLGRYDVWDWQNVPGALEFQYGMRQFNADPNDITFWSRLFTDEDYVDQIIRDGCLLLTHERNSNAMYLRATGIVVEFEGLRCLAINKGLTNSLVFDSGYNDTLHDIMLSFCWYRDHWKLSLYSSRDDIDVSEVAKRFGGGGHKGAAGFQCAELPFSLVAA